MKYKMEEPVKAGIGAAHYQVSVVWRNGSFMADEPVSNGGGDTGPDPYTLLLSSLSTCTLVTLRMYIERKGWDIPEITVRANLFQTEQDGKTVTTFDRELHFNAAITPEQQDRLTEIAGNCPISKILKGDVEVRTFVFNPDVSQEEVKYSNDDITVHWRPKVCKHSARCVSGLPSVFDVNKRPWINTQGATTEEIIRQVESCPTGALTWSRPSGPPVSKTDN